MENRIKQIIAEQNGLELDEITNESSLKNDLNLDSLDFVELTMAIEEEFGFNVDDEEFEKIETVADLISFVKENNSKQNN